MINPEPYETILTNAYNAFNHRDIETVLAMMHPDVDWPNGMEGGIEHGHEAVRNYWTRQWAIINPQVKPLQFDKMDDGRMNVTVHQLVKDLSDNVLADQMIHHIYSIEEGLITRMEIKQS
ncbi:MAG: nuclear transport factor 2 family protein [Chitinophagaceae bacterium]|nr:nuclear transport factor 2 family protein [Chitinophagaceae bacterium]